MIVNTASTILTVTVISPIQWQIVRNGGEKSVNLRSRKNTIVYFAERGRERKREIVYRESVESGM